MFIWWHQVWNKDSLRFDTNAFQRRRQHLNNHTAINQLPYSVHDNCKGQSKCIRKSITEQHSTRMHSICSTIILIHCFNVFVLAIASDNLSNTQQQQPCDRSRRVFTEMRGEISNGPPGYNYTQVSNGQFDYDPLSLFLSAYITCVLLCYEFDSYRVNDALIQLNHITEYHKDNPFNFFKLSFFFLLFLLSTLNCSMCYCNLNCQYDSLCDVTILILL